jgi:uncharacterized protein
VTDVLVDASALIALLDRDDSHHERCVQALKQIRNPLGTVWPAITEAMHLLADTPRAPGALCEMIADGALKVVQIDAPEMRRVNALMEKYRDVPMDFADAVLVVAAERDQLNRILTFDRHFTIYRLPRRARFVVLPGQATSTNV